MRRCSTSRPIPRTHDALTAMTAASTRLTDDDRADIQGFITSGYGHLPVAAYLFVRLHDAAGAAQWVRTLEHTISSSRPWPVAANGEKERPASTVNVAFTAQGLRACGLPQRVVCTFPPEFQEDIATVHRSRILGDTDESDPARWDLGGPEKEFHALVLVHAENDAVLERICREQRALMEQAGVMELPGGGIAGTGLPTIASTSASMTASRNRASPASQMPPASMMAACRPASSSSATRITTV